MPLMVMIMPSPQPTALVLWKVACQRAQVQEVYDVD
jgi:hypothetical protein